jgi:DNA end-binding protein Ku
LQELLAKKQKGLPIAPVRKSAPGNVVNLMEALRASIEGESGGREKRSKPKTPAKPRQAAKRKAG